jgi:2-dehydropantoate 2-reductase
VVRFIIIGAGAIGGTIGGRLFQSAYQVVLVARGEHLAVLQRDGLTMRTPDGIARLPIPAVGGPDELSLKPDDILVLAVKSQDTAAALSAWADADLPVVCAQNGVDNERVAARLFRRVYPMCVQLPATFLRPGEVVAEGEPVSGVLGLGRYPRGLDDTARQVAAALAASHFAVDVDEDVMRWKYAKLLSNLGNAPRLLEGVPGELSDKARAEGEAVLRAAGIAYEDQERHGLRVGTIDGHRRLGSSTWQSLARGTGSIETDYLNGEIVLLGRLHGVDTPVNEELQLAARRLLREGARR